MRIGLQKIVFTTLTLALTAPGQGNAPGSSTAKQDTGKIVQFLSSTISWYRQRAAEDKLVTEPSDLTFSQENARVADQVVQQAFDYGRNEAQLRSKLHPEKPVEGGSSAEFQGLAQALQKVEQQIQDTQAEIQSNREKLTGGRLRNASTRKHRFTNFRVNWGFSMPAMTRCKRCLNLSVRAAAATESGCVRRLKSCRTRFRRP